MISKKIHKIPKAMKSGFSLVEVMLVLGISGLMLVGLLAGTFSSISNQRYTDAVRSFAEQLRSVYNEVISPESLGAGSSKYAILGKVVVFDPVATGPNGDRQFYTATIIGDANININPVQPGSSIMAELAQAEAVLYCGQESAIDASTVSEYTALWQTRFMAGKSSFFGTNPSEEFKGTFIIARSPASNAVHTAYSKDIVFDLKGTCTPDNYTAVDNFHDTLENTAERDKFSQGEAVNICVKSDDVKFVRAVRIAADGRNSSAVSVLNSDELENLGGVNSAEGNPCQ